MGSYWSEVADRPSRFISFSSRRIYWVVHGSMWSRSHSVQNQSPSFNLAA